MFAAPLGQPHKRPGLAGAALARSLRGSASVTKPAPISEAPIQPLLGKVLLSRLAAGGGGAGRAGL